MLECRGQEGWEELAEVNIQGKRKDEKGQEERVERIPLFFNMVDL